MRTSWSPDSKWIAYTLDHADLHPARLRLLARPGQVVPRHRRAERRRASRSSTPRASTSSSSPRPTPARSNQWFDMSNEDTRRTAALYLAVLRKDLPNPLAKESDEEKPKDEKADAAKPADKAAPAAAKAKAGEPAKPQEAFRIDLDGISNRIVAVPIAAGVYSNLQAGENGKIFYRKRTRRRPRPRAGTGDSSIRVYDLVTRKDEAARPGQLRLPADGRPQEDARRLARRLVDPADGRQARAGQRAGSPSRPSRSASCRRPSGPRSSTRPGASTATSSTTRACTAPTGRP